MTPRLGAICGTFIICFALIASEMGPVMAQDSNGAFGVGDAVGTGNISFGNLTSSVNGAMTVTDNGTTSSDIFRVNADDGSPWIATVCRTDISACFSYFYESDRDIQFRNRAAGGIALHVNNESAASLFVHEDGHLIIPGTIKNTTGDPSSPAEAQFTINTFDNTFKLYIDGAWQQIHSW